jgi:5-methylthioadenosine/S-adenosylhomocysteine deaminase
MAEMIRAGTTCFNEMYFYPDIMASAVRSAGLRACIGLPVLEFPTAWAGNADEYLEKGLDVYRQWSGEPRLAFSLAPHAPYSVSDQTLGRIADLSTNWHLPVHMHVLETEWDMTHSLQEHGVPTLQRLAQHELLDSRLLAVHMTQLNETDLRLVAERGVHIIHCPQSNLKLASGNCPISKLQALGVNITVGTDGAASNNNLDLLSEVHTATLLAKGLSGDPRVLDAFAALELITINGARALRMEHEIGSLEVGKQADLAALDLNAPETQPMHNVISQVIYAASSRQFTDLWVAGRRLMDSGNLTTLDLASVLERAQSWQIRMSERPS